MPESADKKVYRRSVERVINGGDISVIPEICHSGVEVMAGAPFLQDDHERGAA